MLNQPTDRDRDRDREIAGWKPVPDPTELTTAALMREIAALKELIFTRLDAMDKAMVLFNDNITRVPTDTDKQIDHLRELVYETFRTVDQRFGGVDQQFLERDARNSESAAQADRAISAALQAAEKAVAESNKHFTATIEKSEHSTTKQIDSLGETLRTSLAALATEIGNVKDRLTRIEGQSQGGNAVWAALAVGAGTLIGIAGLVIAFVR